MVEINSQMIASVGGLLLSFVFYGIFQQKIMQTPYGTRTIYHLDGSEETEEVYFRNSSFLVFNNRIIAIIVAIIVLNYKKESLKNVAPLSSYAIISFSNFFATWCQYSALIYVTFITQTLGKTGKMIAVMTVGKFVNGKKYVATEYIIAAGITGFCTWFLVSGNTEAKGADGNSWWGLLLIAGYLFSDAFTSTFQEKLFKDFTISTYNQMLYVNTSSAILSLMTLVISGGIRESLDFIQTYPAFFWDCILLSSAAVAGQQLIYFIIKNYGALIFSTAMTVRQFLSVLLSCIIFFEPLTANQWLATAGIFVILIYQIKWKQDQRKPAKTIPEVVVQPTK